MNVKQGDLAIIIKSLAGNEGVVVEVLKYVGQYKGLEQAWLVRSPRKIPNRLNKLLFEGYCNDSGLRPVSGLPIEEETKQTEEA